MTKPPRCNRCLNTGGEIPMWGRVVWCRQCATDAGETGRRAIVRHDYGADPEAFTPAVLKARQKPRVRRPTRQKINPQMEMFDAHDLV